MLVYMERADEFYALEWAKDIAHTLRGRVGRAGRLRQCGRYCDRDRALQLIAQRREEGFREVPPPPGLSPRRAAQRRDRLRGVAGAAVAGVLAPAFGPDGYVARVLPGGQLVELGVPLRGPRAAYFRVSVASLPRRIGDVQCAVSALGELEVPYQPWYLERAHERREDIIAFGRFMSDMLSRLENLQPVQPVQPRPELPHTGCPLEDARHLEGPIRQHGMRVEAVSPRHVVCWQGEGDYRVRVEFRMDDNPMRVDAMLGSEVFYRLSHSLRGIIPADRAGELVGVVARFAAELQSRYAAFCEEAVPYISQLESDMHRRFGPRFGTICGLEPRSGTILRKRQSGLYVETARGRRVILPVRMGLDARLVQQQAEAIERLVEGCGLDLTVHELLPEDAARVMRGVIT